MKKGFKSYSLLKDNGSLVYFVLQVLGAVPTISIDKTDGCQMYLNEASMAVEIVSSKSSEMNVLVPKGNGDFVSFLTANREATISFIGNPEQLNSCLWCRSTNFIQLVR